MILEFKYDEVNREGIECRENYITITYNNYLGLNGLVHQIENFAYQAITTLIIWGTHGNAEEICHLSHANIRNLLNQIPRKVKFDTVILDACESACLANEFLERLTDNGIVLCHVGIDPYQVLRDERPERDEILRKVWWSISRNSIKSKSSATFPAICRIDRNLTYYYTDTFEPIDTEGNPFDKDNLDNNLEIIRRYGVDVIRVESNIFINDNFYEQNLQQ